MAEWPLTLPAPQKKISITPSDTRVGRRLQSGRTEYRQFGDGQPDQAKVLFRLTWAQWETFKHFYDRTLNLGLNWFTANWLTTLGYTDHGAKILGYPREIARQGYYVDVMCTMLIQKTDWIIGEDTSWPCAADGGTPVEDIPGYIYGGQHSGDYYQDCDEYTPNTNTWASKTDLPLPARCHLSASTIGSSGYIYGGQGGTRQECDEYTPDVWSSQTSMPSPGRYGLAASTIDSSGYIFGGYFTYRDCDEYTPDVWVSKTDMPTPGRGYLAASTIGSSICIYGGFG